MTPEEHLIRRYFDAFNRHDIEGVMACFHDHPVIVDAEGRRFAGREEVRRSYETSFALFPDGRCDLRSRTGNDGRGMAESLFGIGARQTHFKCWETQGVASGRKCSTPLLSDAVTFGYGVVASSDTDLHRADEAPSWAHN